LRSACDLELRDGEKSLHVSRPEKFTFPSTAELAEELKMLIQRCGEQFAKPAVTELQWKKPGKSGK
jgi:hypothetical protein